MKTKFIFSILIFAVLSTGTVYSRQRPKVVKEKTTRSGMVASSYQRCPTCKKKYKKAKSIKGRRVRNFRR